MYSEKDIKRFNDKVQITDECHIWTGALNKNGYGQISIGTRETQKKIPAHKFSFEIHHGPVPEGRIICHTCDVPCCVNPDHLYHGTHQDNMDDMVERSRSAISFGAAKLTPEQVMEMRFSQEPNSHFVKKFNVSKATISEARNGVTWNELPMPISDDEYR